MADSSSTFQLSDVSDLTPLSSGPEILVPITRAQTMGPRLPTERIKYTTGNCPKFKDTRAMINDPFNKKVYMFLCDQSDAPAPAAYFYSCDIATMRWSNLTVSGLAQCRTLTITYYIYSKHMISGSFDTLQFDTLQNAPDRPFRHGAETT